VLTVMAVEFRVFLYVSIVLSLGSLLIAIGSTRVSFVDDRVNITVGHPVWHDHQPDDGFRTSAARAHPTAGWYNQTQNVSNRYPNANYNPGLLNGNEDDIVAATPPTVLAAIAAYAAPPSAEEPNPDHHDQAESHSSHSKLRYDPTSPTLALLYPPGLLGGYRNQAMRFVAFCRHAIDQNISQLLLPSLLWSTRYPQRSDRGGLATAPFWPVPFEALFDVDHWNSHHRRQRQRERDRQRLLEVGKQINTTITMSEEDSIITLPLLVPTIQDSDCWKERGSEDRNESTQTP
jgi:hypothetical protein